MIRRRQVEPHTTPTSRPAIRGANHMVAAGHYLAAAAGYRILEEGGNAIDAGVASGIALNVVLPQMTSFTGVAPIIVYLADKREVVTVSGLGRWPQSVSLELFQDRFGEIPGGIPRTVVPAACDAWLTALERYGTMTFGQVVNPALELADGGFPVSHRLARSISGSESKISESPESSAVWMPNGRSPSPGDILARDGLARVFRMMIDVENSSKAVGREEAIIAARNLFYQGDIAERMVRHCNENGGFLTMDDFNRFQVKIELPEVSSYKKYEVYTCGSWCQGPSLLQTLNILEDTELVKMGHNSARYLHTIISAIDLAFSDREAYYGDPEFVDVPIDELLSKGYAAERRALINDGEAWNEMPPAGSLGKLAIEGKSATRSADGDVWESDTSYTCVVDRWGNAFSATPSDGEVGFPLVPELGIGISTRGSQSWLDPCHPSSLAPWKRPRLTPNPAMVLKDGALFMPFGTPGGDAQVQAMVQTFLNIVEFDMDPQRAIEQPRAISQNFPNSFWPHRYRPGQVNVEGRISAEVMDDLESVGHKVTRDIAWTSAAGGVCAVVVDRERGGLVGGADPRRESYAIGF